MRARDVAPTLFTTLEDDAMLTKKRGIAEAYQNNAAVLKCSAILETHWCSPYSRSKRSRCAIDTVVFVGVPPTAVSPCCIRHPPGLISSDIQSMFRPRHLSLSRTERGVGVPSFVKSLVGWTKHRL